MTTRNEPSIGNLVTGFFGKKEEKLDHSKIVNDALDDFTKAEQGVSKAIDLIDADIEKENQAIRDAEQRIDEAGQSRNRLARVLDRVKAFTA